MDPGFASNGPRAGRAYSVDTAYQNGYLRQQELTQNPSSQAQSTRFAPIAEDVPDYYAADQTQAVHAHNDEALEQDLLVRYDCQNQARSSFDAEARVIELKQTGSKVVIKRTLRSALQEASEVDREINVLSTVQDASIPILIESLELKDVIWTVKQHQNLQTLADLTKENGPLPEEVLKTALNQLFLGVAALFFAGFAHLRICPDTVCFDMDRQLVLTNFQYACTYGTDKVGDMYAITSEKYGDDIYVAPEVFASNTYNARKAVIWSCGVTLYFMVTGQTEKLSNLDHPAFESTAQASIPEPSRPSSRRRASSAVAPPKIIHYPSNRFDIPNYARWIIPKMLITDPTRRAELIEVATRVPKDFSDKPSRPLVELAWLDYKDHVGPMAGLNLSPENGSSASSIFSMASAMSNPFRSLLGKGHSRRQSAPVNQGGVRW